jgi:uncharacterized LabA/DUF88 family protein
MMRRMSTEPPHDPPLPTSILVIDGTNIERRCQESFGRTDFDFNLFFAKVACGTRLLQAHYFTAPLSRSAPAHEVAAQSAKFNVLKTLPHATLYLGRYQPRTITCKQCHRQFQVFVEKGTDVAVGIMLVECAIRRRADILFLLAGDNDYMPALKLARSEGVRVVVGFVISPLLSEAHQIMAVADLRHNSERFIKLDQAFMADCWRPAKPPH